MHFIKLIYKINIFLFLCGVAGILGLYTRAYLSKPVDLNQSDAIQLFDDNNQMYYDTTNSKDWVKLSDISENLINAVISVEDKNFYKHNGFDYIRIIKAMYNNMRKKAIVEGASTISQQFIKNAYLEFDQTWSRKLREALLTINLEVHYSKDEILEAYLNTINYGQGNYGIKEASQYYFNKTPMDLSLEEAIMLAGIPKNPSNYNPIKNYDKSVKRAKTVALTMLNNNYISQDDYNSLFNNELTIYKNLPEDKLSMINYYQDAVLKELKELPNINEEQINSGNLKVYTTLNYEAQKSLEKEITQNLTEKNIQVAGVIVNPKDGGIVALTGGVDYLQSQYNRALYSKRQVGSSMKPFLYYAALENGMTSSSTFLSQYTTFNLSNGKTYSPKNYNSVYPNKEITMATAIAYSDNVYAVKTNLFLGFDALINTAKKCGINEKLNPVASLALGTSEINLIDFATGYTTLASGGYKRDLHLITKVVDEDNNILYEYKNKNNLVLNPNYVYILNELLTSTTSSAFKDYNTPTALMIASKLSQKYAIKSGTTDTDHWDVGYNNDKLFLLWTGYDDNSPLDSNIGIKTKNIWANVMESVINKDNQNQNWYQMPSNVIGLPLNSIDGTKASDTQKTNIFYYVKGSEPS